MSVTVIVEVATNEFDQTGQYGGGNGSTHPLVILSRLPNPVTERFNGNLGAPDIVAKTAAEITAAQMARDNARADKELQRGLLAVMATMFKDRTGVFPNAPQRAQLKADFITIWKTLG